MISHPDTEAIRALQDKLMAEDDVSDSMGDILTLEVFKGRPQYPRRSLKNCYYSKAKCMITRLKGETPHDANLLAVKALERWRQDTGRA